MTDKKISELDAAATLDGTELVPIVQSGETVRTTVSDLVAAGGSDENVILKTSDYDVLTGDDGATFTNGGASGTVELTLPTAAANLHYGFAVEASHLLEVTGQVTDSIIVGSKRFDPVAPIPGDPFFDHLESGAEFTVAQCNSDLSRVVAADNTNGKIYRSSDGGHTYLSSVVDTSFYCVMFVDDGDTLLAGDGSTGKIWRSIDFGANWSNIATAGAGVTWIVCDDTGTICYAATFGDGVWKSTDGGANWSKLAGSGTLYTYQIACSSDGSKLVMSDLSASDGTITISDDSGATWTATSAQPTIVGTVYGAACSADGQHLIVADEGTSAALWYSDDRGATWTASSATSDFWYLLSSRQPGTSGATLVASEYDSGGIWKSTDYGHTWTQDTNFNTTDWGYAAITSDGAHIIGNGYLTNHIRVEEQQPDTPGIPVTIQSDTPDSYLGLLSIDDGLWIARSITGKWLVGSTIVFDDSSSSAIIEDTIANILAMTPDAGLHAYATDLRQTLIADGTSWNIDSSYYTAQPAAPDMGAAAYSNRIGYGEDYVTDKLLAHIRIGFAADDVPGAFRFDPTKTKTNSLEVFAEGAWRTLVANFVMRERTSDQAIEHQPVGFTEWIAVFTGDSEDVGLNGLPLVQGYKISMGAYPVIQLVDGGTF